MSKNKPLIIWAVDPYNIEKSLLTKSIIYLEKLARDLGAKIKPVYILSPNSFYLPTDYFIPPTMPDFARHAKLELDETLSKIKSKAFLPGTVILDSSNSLRGAAATFIENAKDEKALCIFATTHGRRGLPRFWLGSFVETLLMYSPIPVIALNPTTKSSSNISSILLPTDLSKSSSKSLQKIIPLAKRLNAKIYILHVLRHFEGTAWGDYSMYTDTKEEVKASAQKRLSTWVKTCEKARIPCEAVIVDTFDSVTDAILKVAKEKNVKLVAMAALSGPIENVLTGGITRQVVRYGECPTWVVH
jgi:nucleotide-binding universal stress UspA family protein